MLLECQKDSYKKEFATRVVSCEQSHLPSTLKTKNGESRQDCFRIILEDTILFPEGGGQPDDRGVIDGVQILRVLREDNTAAHYALLALPVGKEVVIHLDWKRRFDHMQQHSAQHLITAIAEQKFSASTTSWWLGEMSSYIELDIDITKFKESHAEQIELIVNEYVVAGEEVKVNVFDEGDEGLKEARTRGLPEDHKGQVRVVSMAGLDLNMCCGTHVKSLGHLQAIKILCFEKGKKGKTNLHFVAGGRILASLSQCLGRQKQLGALLKNGPEEHVLLVEKLQKSLKVSEKTSSLLWKEVAKFETDKFKLLTEKPIFYELHRKDASPEFISTFIKEVLDQTSGTLFFLSSGEEKGEGQITIVGPSEIIPLIGPLVAEMLGGKGAVSGGRFQAKVTNMKRRKDAVELIKTHMNKAI